MNRGAFLLIAVIFVIQACATTVRLVEVTRSGANQEGASWVFTSAHPDFAHDVFTIVGKQVVRRRSDGQESVIADISKLNLTANGTMLKRAAIHPDPLKDTIVIAVIRDTTAAEKLLHRAKNDNKPDTPAPYMIEAFKFTLSVVNVATPNMTAVNEGRRLIVAYPTWDVTYDIGEVRFVDNLLFIGTGNSLPMNKDIWDFYQHGREAHSLQGKLLRFDLDRERNADGAPFVAVGNPFINTTIPPVVFSRGFVWLTTVIKADGELWGADIQSGKADELNLIQSEADYGWNIAEGDMCVNPPTNCVKANTVAPEVFVKVPAHGHVDSYGISGIVRHGSKKFLASWFGAIPNGTLGVMQLLDANTKKATDVNVVDQRGVGLNWYYRELSIIRLTSQDVHKPIYALGRYGTNGSSVLFRVEEVPENNAGRVSILVAVVLAIVAVLFH